MKTVAHAARAVVGSGPFVGALYVLALTAGSGRASREAELDLIRRAEAYEPLAALRLEAEIARVELGAAAMAVAFGIALGLVAELLAALRAPPRRPAARAAREVIALLVVVACAHAIVALASMAAAPHAYADRWYDEGGLPRTVQVLATDVLGAGGVALLGALLAVLYVRPRRIGAWTRRGLGRVRGLGGALLAKRSSPAAVVLALGAGAAIAAGGARATKPAHAAGGTSAAEGAPMNVLVLAAGSLRADRLDPRLAPNLARLAERGARFDRAYSSLPQRAPAWATLLTGRSPHHHGIRSELPTREERARPLDALPARLASAGFTTALLTDGGGVGELALGFERVDAPSSDLRDVARQRALARKTALLPLLHSRVGRSFTPTMGALRSADPRSLADAATRALRGAGDAPFFMTVVFSTTREPYAAPAPHYATHTDPAYRGRYKYGASRALGDPVPLDEEDLQQVRALYDGAVMAVDEAIGRVLQSLEALGLGDRTIVVVTSDHGEGLGDHGRGHGARAQLFGDEGTRVPLVIVDPRARGEGRRVDRVVRDVDLAPTLYELAGVAPPADLDGRSLAPAVRGEPIDARLAYAETAPWLDDEAPPADLRVPYAATALLAEEIPGRGASLAPPRDPTMLVARHRMVRGDRYKLVYVPSRSGVRYALFDTLEDPGETRDVADALPEEVSRLRSELWAWMLRDPAMERRGGFLVPREPARARGGR